MTCRRLAVAAVFALALPPTAMAQDITFTPDDEIAMQQCIETITAINADDDPETNAAYDDCIGTVSDPCQNAEGGSSTPGIVECTQRETAWWDQWLNDHYSTLQSSLEPELFTSLQTAQRAWLAYRDAKCSFLYDYWSGGSIRSVVFATCVLTETAHRSAELATLLNPEG